MLGLELLNFPPVEEETEAFLNVLDYVGDSKVLYSRLTFDCTSEEDGVRVKGTLVYKGYTKEIPEVVVRVHKGHGMYYIVNQVVSDGYARVLSPQPIQALLHYYNVCLPEEMD